MAKKNCTSGLLQPKRIVMAVSAAFLPWLSTEAVLADPAANQLPTGGNVAAGAASISVTGSKMQIDQSSDKAILNWNNFSIGSSGWVNFSQPSSSSVALNRSMQPAEIFGRLSANGQVFITSQAGVYFARSAQVDVGGLVATNLSIRDQDFMAGRYVFSNEGSSGAVVNEGTIITPAGYAALAGTQVRNDGVIVARAGTVALAAGDRVTLDMVGDGLIKVSVDAAALNALALNSGTIQADGGRVVLTARSANALLDTVVNNTGVIRARSLIERNGEIVLDGGSAGIVSNSGSIDASGTAGTTGGNVQVTGQHVALTEGSSIDASGDAGGGTVTVKAVDAAFVYGTINATDTGGNGKGGSVETSGKYLEVTRAPNAGAGGTWLIDPYNIDVVEVAPPPGYSDNSGPTGFTPSGDNSQIAASLITDQLNAGANVILDTGAAGSPGTQAGDIRVLAAIDKTVANPASLTLKAFHDVQVDQPISIASAFGPTGFGTLTIDAGNDVVVSAPITTLGGGLSIRAGGFTNQSAINNGVGGDLKPGMAIFADQFDLAGGTINGGQGSVGLFTRTATNSLGVESAGDTRITNADIASITTSPDLPSTNANQLLIGVGSGGTMRIGDDAQVNGGSKNLVFSGGFGPGTRITVGTNGVTTTGDVVLDGSGGSIAGGGTVGGNHVVLRASSGIGTSSARVTTAATTLAVNTGGNAFVSETDNVTLDNIAMMGQTFTNGVSGSLDFAANGSVTVNGSVFAAGSMNFDVAQDLNVIASPGRAAGLFTNGNQNVSAANISVQAALSGNNGRATISNTGGTGNQVINVLGDSLSVTAGAGGFANSSGIITNGNQTINGNAEITITGGGGAGSIATNTHNSAAIQTNGSGKTQTINAAAITVKAGAGNDAFAGIIGANQAIVVSGDVQLTGGAGTGAPIVRIGGVSGAAPGATNLFLSARDVILTGGDSATGEAGLGSTPIGTSPQPNTINVAATRDVILDARNGGTRIGTSQTWATSATGDISINAGRNIELKGGPSTAVIRTASNVTLHADQAGGTISETGNGFIQAGTLSITSSGSTSLVGQNQVSMFNGTTSGTDLTLNNSGALTVANLSAANATLTNAGNVTLGGPWSTSGASSISIASDLTVNNNVQSSGPMTLDVNGAVRVVGSGVQDASLASFGGQTINARSMEVTSLDGRFVSVRNTGPNAQTINLANGAGLDVQTLSGGGFAQVSADGGGNQTIRVADGDHVNVNGWRGNAWIVNPGGIQTLSLTGSGANAITIGGAGALGFSQIRGGNQSISAGQIGESGSIGMTGADANGTFTGIASDQRVAGTQTVSTSGTLRITGGNAPNQPPAGFATGLFHNGSGEQRVSAANIEMQGGASGVNNAVIIIASPLAGTTVPGDQIIEASGGMALRGGSGTSNGAGIFQNRTGSQRITASNLLLQGGSAGSSNGVFINATFGGDQEFNVGGTISLTAGSGGIANQAGIFTNGNQAINGNPEITLNGGAGGTGSIATNTQNNASIQTNGVGKTQTINASAITVKGGSGNDTFAVIAGANQTILVSGDVQLTGGAGTGTPIARIGGPGGAVPFASNLFLSARDVILTGGNAAAGDAGLGSTVVGTSPQPNTINVTATRDVILDGGSGGARIGTSQNFAMPASGDISVSAGRNIELNGGASSAAIRTAGNVTLNAGGGISENPFNAVVAANSLTTNSGGSTSLVGSNQVSTFNGSSGGDLSLTNAGDLTINNNTSSSGAMTLDVAGKLSVSASGTQDAMVHSFGGQTITARAVEVSARDGRSASLWNTGPSSQSIAASNGAGVDVLVPSGGGFAQILADAGSSQSITVVDGDHINVNGATGSASIIAFNTPQTLSITGSGANAITMGSAGATGSSIAHGSKDQSVTAGNVGEAGSITITGPGVNNALAGLYGNPNLDGTQTISTSGVISITGGTAPSQPSNFFTGIAHNGSGQQTITAAGITLTGGSSGSGNTATIGAFGGGVAANAGKQVIDVGDGSISLVGGAGGNANTAIINALREQTITAADIVIQGGPGGSNNAATIVGSDNQGIHAAGGSIVLRGSDAGFNNRASIFSNGNQTIDGNPDIFITAGSAGGAVGLGNTAGIGTAAGRVQTIRAGTLELTSGAGGIDATAFISGGVQDIRTTGDFRVTGGASGGTRGAALVGGPGGGPVLQPTILTLDVGRDLILSGGSGTNDAASIGSSALGTGTPTNDITITVGRDVILNSGTGAGARIGTSVLVAPTDGHISITAGRNIELNGTAQSTVIRTAGSVELHAGGAISEATNGFVVAGTLDTTSGGAQNLIGPNQVASFTASAGGDVGLRNTASVLTLGTMDLSGSLGINQTGALAVPGTVSARDQSIQATGDVTVGGADGGFAGLFAPGAISISTPQSVVLRGSDSTFLGASTVAAGGLVTLNAGEVHLVGGAAPLAAASILGGELAITSARDISLTAGSGWNADALLYSRSNITMTIGGILTIDGGHRPDNWARVQTEQREGNITLNFPNAQSGSFFVDGFEGKIKHGQDGFFTADKPAKLGHTLFLQYGL